MTAKLTTLKPRLQPPVRQHQNWGNGRRVPGWAGIKKRVHARDQYTCQQCGVVTMKLECDHIVNKARGGSDDMSNLQSLCVSCHRIKTQAESRGGSAKFTGLRAK